MIPTKQKLGGLFISLLSAAGTVFVWYEAIYDGTLYEKASMVFPGFVVFGLAAMFLPSYKQERLSNGEDVSNFRWKTLTPVWRVVLIVSLVVGFGNYLLLRLSFNWNE